MTEEKRGSVHVSPGVVATLARLTAEAVPGVARVGGGGGRSPLRFLPDRLTHAAGVTAQIAPDGVRLELTLIVQQGASMLEVASRVQREVGEAVEKTVGLPVREVNVRIQDVQ
jgi:uncharacterized alkaline shock family protein YloU